MLLVCAPITKNEYRSYDNQTEIERTMKNYGK